MSDSDDHALAFARAALIECPLLLADGKVTASTVVIVDGVRYVVAISREAPGALGLVDAAPASPAPLADAVTTD